METAHELFIHGLADMLSGERQLIDALKTQADNASNPQLQKAISSHRQQTEKQAQRLEQVFKSIGESPEDTECKGIKGLIEEYETFAEQEDPADDILDTFTIGAAMKVETYEIDAYNELINLARSMRHAKAVKLLQQNLSEEKSTLTKLKGFQKKIKPERTGHEEIDSRRSRSRRAA
jgi:ferritin-like metal-binding protein YciE